MKKNSYNKLYVMDKSLDDSVEDQFNHEEIADEIANLIKNDEYKTPYNIALIGKWGVGKTSILKLVKNKLQNKKYKMITINMWKYEKESLKHEFLKNILEQITGRPINYDDELQDYFNKSRNEDNLNKKNVGDNSVRNFFRGLKESFIIFLSRYKYFICWSFIISIIWEIVHYNSNIGDWERIIYLIKNNILFLISRVFDFYFNRILITLILPIIVKNIIDNHQNNKAYIFDSKKDYEPLLRNELNKEKNISKFIIVMDDIDRLSAQKMVEALDTLKTLMEMDKLIFVVPFDDSIIKEVLKEKVIKEFDNEYHAIESELILDKLFQFRFYIPPLIPSDLSDYTLNIIKNDATSLYEYFDENEIKEIVNTIFMYKGITTPRQIKKLINIFSNNINLFYRRIADKRINQTFYNKESKLMIAKLSVLQSDFNDFYDELMIEPNLCRYIVEIDNGKHNQQNDLKSIKDKYFINEKNAEELYAKSKFEDLINFLNKTAHIDSDDITTYLYLKEDKASYIYGSKLNRELLDNMTSMSFRSMNEKIKEHKEIDLNKLLMNYIENVNPYNLPMIITSIFNIDNFDFSDNNLNNEIINSIKNIYLSGKYIELEKLDMNNVLKLKERIDNDSELIKLINKYYKYIIDNEENTISIFNITLNNINIILNVNKEVLSNYLITSLKTGREYIEALNESNVEENVLKEYFGTEAYNYLIKQIKLIDPKTSDYDIYSTVINKLYDAIKKDNANNNIINNGLIELLNENEKNLSLVSNIVSNNKDYIPKEMQQEILNKVITFNNNGIDEQYKIINNLTFNNANAPEKLEHKLLIFIDEKWNIEKILNNLDSYQSINNVINKINTLIYNDSSYDIIYQKNKDKMTEDQIYNLFNTLSKIINKETYRPGRITTIYKFFEENEYIDSIIVTFTNTELIENNEASNEIIALMINDDDVKDKSIINNYINRIIEILPTYDEGINLLYKLKEKLSNDNIKRLSATLNDDIINKLDEKTINILLEIVKNQKNDDEVKISISDILNKLIYNDKIKEKAIKYIIEKDIKINDSSKFIFEGDNLKYVSKYKNIRNILAINEEFDNKAFEKLYEKEFTEEQIKNIALMDDNIIEKLDSYSFKYNYDELFLLKNYQKFILISNDEERLVEFQINILKSEDEKLISQITSDFKEIKKRENKKELKIAISELYEKDNTSSIVKDKLDKLLKINRIGIKKKD